MPDPTPRPHTFHIPVMGLGYTIDTPLKVAHFGISSVVSIIEDELVERMREHHCGLAGEPFLPIAKQELDHRAQRITAYLDLLQRLVDRNMERVRQAPFQPGSDSTRYFELHPDASPLKQRYIVMLAMAPGKERDAVEQELRLAMVPGAIDVNIMAKIDPVNYDKAGDPLPEEYCDAMSAFRGFANSTLRSAVVLSAGYNPRLYNYITRFADLRPDAQGVLRKRIILKVSDVRSSLVQGRLLAKKGLWVSEYRLESGLNCGGHAFATEGLLMGPILEDLKAQREAIATELFTLCQQALVAAGHASFMEPPAMRITAQGGIGTAAEDRFLREHYALDGTGWGSPFLLVPEATNVDAATMEQLIHARPSDFYLSWASPLGVPFHNFKPSTSERQRLTRIAKGRPGSACYKKYLSNDTEFTERPICTASRQYQDLKIKQIKASGVDMATMEQRIAAVTEKDCLCEGLGASALLNAGMEPAHKLKAVAICPGPNMAYFNKVVSLRAMVDHIHGRTDLLAGVDRPHMFMKELGLYVDYLKREMQQAGQAMTARQQRYFAGFRKNLEDGLRYYTELIPTMQAKAAANVERFRADLDGFARELRGLDQPVALEA